MSVSKVIILDIDGPMIPTRAHSLPTQTKLFSVFDPCAVSLLNNLIIATGAQIVISSTWASQGLHNCIDLLHKNNVIPQSIHNDWRTPRKLSSTRTQEIGWWLQEHHEVTHYVAFDDEQLDAKALPGFVQCDMDEGLSYKNYIEAKILLGIATDLDKDKLLHLQRKEIWRTQRHGDAHESLTWRFADTLFPVTRDVKPHLIRGRSVES